MWRLRARRGRDSRLRGNDGSGWNNGKESGGQDEASKTGRNAPRLPILPQCPVIPAKAGTYPAYEAPALGRQRFGGRPDAGAGQGRRRRPVLAAWFGGRPDAGRPGEIDAPLIAHCAPNSSAVAVPSPSTSARSLG